MTSETKTPPGVVETAGAEETAGEGMTPAAEEAGVGTTVSVTGKAVV